MEQFVCCLCRDEEDSAFTREYSGGDVSCYLDSSLCVPEDSVLSEDDSTSPGRLSEEDDSPPGEDRVSWLDDISSGQNPV